MKSFVFVSDQFRPYLPDECQVNPNCLGFELAYWLSSALAQVGVITSYPISEDWGWLLEHLTERREWMIGCSGSAVAANEFEWQIFVRAPRNFFRRRQPDEKESGFLMEAIANCLTANAIVFRLEE